jgi:hypothetical protein
MVVSLASVFRKSLILLVVTIFCGLTNVSYGQLSPTGSWKSHLSYQRILNCEASSRYIYAAAPQGFFRVKESTNEIEILGKDDGFNGQEITCLSYNSEKNLLFIGYRDGNIDVLFNDAIIHNIPGYFNKPLQGDKSIYHCYFNNNQALVSTYFGLLVIDLLNFEISDSYNAIGEQGISIPVYGSCINKDSLYIGTLAGIRKAPWNKLINLNDFNEWNWAYQSNGRACNELADYKDSLYFHMDSIAYRYYQGNINPVNTEKRRIARIWSNNNGLHIVYPGTIKNIGGSTTQSINLVYSATQFSNGIYWFGTGIQDGLIKKDPNGEIAYLPSGPATNSAFKMTKHGNYLLTTAGGVTATFGNSFNTGGFYIHHQGVWKNNINHPLNTNLYDFTYSAYAQKRDCQIAATHSFGVLIFKNNEIIARWDETNSPLKKRIDGFIWVSGICEDSKGNIWILSYGAESPLLCYTTSGTWKTFELGLSGENELKGLEIDKNNNKWMIRQRGGILVFNEGNNTDAKSDDQYILLTAQNGLRSNEVNTICADNLGYVWIGTNQGLNIFTGSGKLFSNPKLEPFVIEQNGSIGYLMGEENITDILYDGGNRKWMSTTNGLFLVEPYGQRVVRHFQTSNSPLISNRIACLGQIDETGEIFMGTDMGIQSYRSDAKADQGSFEEQIKIYPNPVHPTYSGLITIEGLTNNAIIKITDAQGRLIYETKANGGKATWDGKRLNGTIPNSGVLLVFAVNEDGSESAMGKFVFIRPEN